MARAEVTTNDNEILKDESHLQRMNGADEPLWGCSIMKSPHLP